LTKHTRQARHSGIAVSFYGWHQKPHVDKQADSSLHFEADEYGDNEDLLGKWFAANPDKRQDVFLSTKFAIRGNPKEGMKGLTIDSSPEYCKQAIQKSLKRLGLPYVDIYYVHRVDKKTPIEKTMQAMIELKNEGKIKYIGLSECSADTIRRAHAVHPVTAMQIEYSPFCLEIELPKIKVLETCR
jgi:aryl-alcohol dehydrogenase-like predicted oxidoreductase